MVDRLRIKSNQSKIEPVKNYPVNPFEYKKRITEETGNFGKENVPRVVADFSKLKKIEVKDLKSAGHFYLPELDKWTMNDLGADYIYTGSYPVRFMLPNGFKRNSPIILLGLN